MNRREELALALKKSAESSVKAAAFINLFTDEQSFIESGAFVASETLAGTAYGEGVLCGSAAVGGTEVFVACQNSAALKGAMGEMQARKILKTIDKAGAGHSPLISVIDTAGARIDEGTGVLEAYAKLLSAAAGLSGHVPHIAVIKGSCFGLMSFYASLADIIIQIDKSQLVSASPLVIAARGGTDAAKIGTAAFHSKKTGAVSLVAKNEKEAAEMIKKLISFAADPLTEGDDINRILNVTDSGDVKKLLTALADKGTLLEIRDSYGTEAITALGRLGGRPVGFVVNNPAVNNGRVSCAGARKISDFLFLLSAWGLPVINVVQCHGAEASLEAEEKEIIPAIAALAGNYAGFNAPRLSLIVGDTSGAGYTLFAAKGLGYDFTVAWADASVSVLESGAAANLIYGAEIAASTETVRDKAVQKIAKDYSEKECSALKAAEKGYIDAVILPEHSRLHLAAALESLLS